MKKHAKNKSNNNSKSNLVIDVNDAVKISERLNEMAKMASNEDDIKILLQGAKLIELLITIYSMWSNSKKKVNRLLKMIFGNRSEKLKDLPSSGKTINNDTENNAKNIDGVSILSNKRQQCENAEQYPKQANEKEKKKRNGGGGKNSADDYESAAEIYCKLDDDKLPGQICPECKENKLFEIDPKKVIRLVGKAPVTAFKFIQQQTRCICGMVYTADVGDEFREIYNGDKYSPSALATIMIHKFLMGVTYGKLEKIQRMSGVPIPATTQMNKIKNDALPVVQAIVGVLSYLATNAGLLAFDDTRIRTLEKRETKDGGETHNGHGTAIIAGNFDNNETEIVLFNFEASKHAGEVICELLANRERDQLPLLVSDGLPCYDESKTRGIDVNCNTHARRKVVDEDPERKTYVGYAVLECYKNIYTHEAYCRDNKLNNIERMEYHKQNSESDFEKIKIIFNVITGKNVELSTRQSFGIPDYLCEEEPNDDLYKTAKYYLDRYDSLTQVLRYPGVPLDTNSVERTIKSIILIRKTSLFFNNHSSACYSGEILSLLETADHSNVNVFEYMDYILTNKKAVLKNPRNYLPWIFQKSDKEKKQYWKLVDKLIKTPSSFGESVAVASYHSSS